MIAREKPGLAKRAFHLGRRQLGYMYYRAQYYAQYWGFRLTEGRRLRKLKNIHAGERCFIIGNGPSIRQQDLTKLKDEMTFVTNWFVLYEDYERISPNFYCVSDPKFFDLRDGREDRYEVMMEKTSNALRFFPLLCKQAISKQGLFQAHRVFYLNYPPYGPRVWESGKINLDVTKRMYTGDTAIIDFCLPLAFYMGFTEVYLLGCDSDYGIDKDDSYKQAYFYNIGDHKTERQTLDYHRKFWFNNVINSYQVAKEAFESNGRKIYNAGIGGKLEVFERVDFEKVLAT